MLYSFKKYNIINNIMDKKIKINSYRRKKSEKTRLRLYIKIPRGTQQ